MRPIDADALNERFEELKNNPNNSLVDVVFLDGAMSVVDVAPTLDYAPVRRGEWIECACDDPYRHTCNMRYRCSECGRFALNQEPYCHCGAKMKEDGKDENA